MIFIELTLWNGEPISIRLEDILRYTSFINKRNPEGMRSEIILNLPTEKALYIFGEPTTYRTVPTTSLILRETYEELKEIINNG